jgi:transposase
MDGEPDDEAAAGCPNCERLEREIADLRGQFERLTAALEEQRRAGKRQAAPFRKQPPKPEPKTPGRKPGEAYGEHHRRPEPHPDDVDEVLDAALPDACPDCGGGLTETGVAHQFQTEIVRTTIVRRFDVHLGECRCCTGRVQGRHPLQTSDALGAAASQLGAEAHAALAILNKELGLSHGKSAALMKQLFGLVINRSTSARSIQRTAWKCEPAYREIREAVRGSPRITADETGWRIGGWNAWLHVFVGTGATCFEVAPDRSADVLAGLIGWDWIGTLIHDGWAPYDRFTRATHQQCLAHPLRRCHDMLETATRSAARFPRAVSEVLKSALAVRDRFVLGELTGHGRLSLRGKLVAELRRLTQWPQRNAENERLRKHVAGHLEKWFTFLRLDDIDATNWRAEQAIRPAVVNRKVWGGNRTDAGAFAQSVLTSILTTCRQRTHDALAWLANTLRATTPLPLLGGGR